MLVLGPRAGFSLGAAALGKGGFSLDAFMAAQSDGLYFDFTKTDRLFQENVGPTPANDPGEVIGLALSQRAWAGKTLAELLAAQTEMRSGGTVGLTGSAPVATFNTSTGAGTAARVDGSNLSFVAFPAQVGRFYQADIQNTGAVDLTLRHHDLQIYATVAAGQRQSLYVPAMGVSVRVAPVINGSTIGFTVHSFKEVPGKHATQATLSFKPKFQTTGAAFDGVDDNLLTAYTAGAGANFIAAKVTVPASIPTTYIVAGSAHNTFTNNLFLGFSTVGQLRFSVGSMSTTSVGPDYRGTTVVAAITNDGTTTKAFADDAEVFSASQVGATGGATPIRLGALNSDGTAGNFFGGTIHSLVAGREFLDLAKFKQIASKL